MFTELVCSQEPVAHTPVSGSVSSSHTSQIIKHGLLQSRVDVVTLPSLCRQYDLRENSKRSEVLIDLTEYCGQLVEAKCLTVNPQDNNYLAVGASGPFVRLYDIRMIHNHRYQQLAFLGLLGTCEWGRGSCDNLGPACLTVQFYPVFSSTHRAFLSK